MKSLKKHSFSYGLALIGVLSGCVGRSVPETIGTAFMQEDGTLTLRLVGETDGAIAHAYFDVTPDDERYEMYLEHIGDIQPGDEVYVRPFPSASD